MRELKMDHTLRKISEIQALLDEIVDKVADTAERLAHIEQEDRRRAALNKFFAETPIKGTNGVQTSGVNGINIGKDHRNG
jgi:hypothetical protein